MLLQILDNYSVYETLARATYACTYSVLLVMEVKTNYLHAFDSGVNTSSAKIVREMRNGRYKSRLRT